MRRKTSITVKFYVMYCTSICTFDIHCSSKLDLRPITNFADLTRVSSGVITGQGMRNKCANVNFFLVAALNC
jgi:hypothetical protein